VSGRHRLEKAPADHWFLYWAGWTALIIATFGALFWLLLQAAVSSV
jgi:hypothetical protein